MGAGRLRWWSSGESRSDLNLRLHEQWQKEQGEKGFLPQSERWPTIPADDLSFSPAVSTMAVMNKWFDETYEKPVERRWYGQRWISGNFDVVPCPHVPEGTSYLLQGEFNCSLCAKEKAMENEVDVDTVQMGWAGGQVRVRRVPTLGEYEFLLVAGNRSGDYCFPGTLHPGEDLVRELSDAVGIRDAQGFAPKKIDLNAKSFEQLKAIVKSTMRYSTLSMPSPTVDPSHPAIQWLADAYDGLDREQRLDFRLRTGLMLTDESGGVDDLKKELRREQDINERFTALARRLLPDENIYTYEQLEGRIDELLDLESIFDRNSILVDESKLSPEEIRRLTNDHCAQHIKAIAPVDDHDKHVAANLAAIINAPPPTVAGRVDLAEYLLKEKHVGMAEYPGILDTGRLPEEKEAVTFTSSTGEKLTMHFPKEKEMGAVNKMTMEEYRARYGAEPEKLGPDEHCKACGRVADRKIGLHPTTNILRGGLVPDIHGWMRLAFPWDSSDAVAQELVSVCPPCAEEVSKHMAYLREKKSGEAFGLSDEDLLADDA